MRCGAGSWPEDNPGYDDSSGLSLLRQGRAKLLVDVASALASRPHAPQPSRIWLVITAAAGNVPHALIAVGLHGMRVIACSQACKSEGKISLGPTAIVRLADQPWS